MQGMGPNNNSLTMERMEEQMTDNDNKLHMEMAK
jgi:hypothetical protein